MRLLRITGVNMKEHFQWNYSVPLAPSPCTIAVYGTTVQYDKDERDY